MMPGSQMPGDQLSAGRVLVIDDQEVTRYVLRRILARVGFQVEEAQNGADGLRRAALGPDLVICDVNLPDMLGYDVCRRLKSNPLTGSIPVLQISASFVSDESKVQALEGGADSYLTQPIEPTVLIAQVNSLLRLRRAETTANLSARQWQSTFDSLSDGIALLDPDKVIVRTNRTLLDMLGLVTTSTEGKPFSTILSQKFDKSFDEIISKLEGNNSIELCSDKRWFRLRYNIIDSDPAGDSGSIVLLTEITDQKMLQETLKFNERLAATGRLAHVIAHEINNPLEALSNLLYLAENTAPPAGQTRDFVQQASLQLGRISQITKQVLAYHRESKEPIAARADELLEGALAIYRAQMMSLKVTLDLRAKCTRRIFAHPGEIRQVFGNLITNALDAISPSGGTLHIRCVNTIDLRSARKGIRFLFSDSGTGIPESALVKIFDAFFTTKGLQGSGVGLWLSAEILAKHDGYLRVRTRTAGPFRGTLFSMFLPEHLTAAASAELPPS